MKDMAGNFAMQDLVRDHCKDADCIILCYNLTSRRSFENLPDWLEEIEKDSIGKNLPVALVATKSDLAQDQRQVSEDLGYRKKGDIGDKCILFRETTTYGNDVSSVNLLFTEVAEMIV